MHTHRSRIVCSCTSLLSLLLLFTHHRCDHEPCRHRHFCLPQFTAGQIFGPCSSYSHNCSHHQLWLWQLTVFHFESNATMLHSRAISCWGWNGQECHTWTKTMGGPRHCWAQYRLFPSVYSLHVFKWMEVQPSGNMLLELHAQQSNIYMHTLSTLGRPKAPLPYKCVCLICK